MIITPNAFNHEAFIEKLIQKQGSAVKHRHQHDYDCLVYALMVSVI